MPAELQDNALTQRVFERVRAAAANLRLGVTPAVAPLEAGRGAGADKAFAAAAVARATAAAKAAAGAEGRVGAETAVTAPTQRATSSALAAAAAAAEKDDGGDAARLQRVKNGIALASDLAGAFASLSVATKAAYDTPGAYISQFEIQRLASKAVTAAANVVETRAPKGVPQPFAEDAAAGAAVFEDQRRHNPRRCVDYPTGIAIDRADGRLSQLCPRGLFIAHMASCDGCVEAEARGGVHEWCPIHTIMAQVEGVTLQS